MVGTESSACTRVIMQPEPEPQPTESKGVTEVTPDEIFQQLRGACSQINVKLGEVQQELQEHKYAAAVAT